MAPAAAGAALAGCALAGAIGVVGLDRHARAPGLMLPAPQRWPEASALRRAKGGLTVVMFAHPRCPCTRAGLHELRDLIESARSRPTTHIVIVAPEGMEEGAAAEIESLARRIPGALVHVSGGAAEAARFGARTSGLTLVYDPAGALRFAGGLTALRGHIGLGEGGDAVAALLAGEHAAQRQSDVLGCPLFEHEPPAASLANGNLP